MGLRIAVVSPLHESVPPQLYGGTERVVSYLTEELVRLLPILKRMRLPLVAVTASVSA